MMKVIGFVEGASLARGGMGIAGTPLILSSLASTGAKVVLFVAGAHSPGLEKFLAADADQALRRVQEKGTYGMVTFPAYGSWMFAPSMIREAMGTVRDADFVSLHSFYSFPVLLGYVLARVYRKPYGVWPHGVFSTVQRRSGIQKKWLYDKLIGKRVLEQAAVVFYSAKGERRDASPLNIGAPSVIIPEGMDTEPFKQLPPRGKFRERYLGGHDGPLVLFLARLTAKKGLDLLIKAMSIVCTQRPNVRLAIVGGGDPISFKDKVVAWISQASIEASTVLTGRISQAEKLEALADADVFVLPSEAENFGFSMFEAMASRIPVVVSNTLDFAGEVAEANAGFVMNRDAVEFSGAIIRLIDNPVLRKLQGKNGAQLAASFTWDQNGTSLSRTIKSIIGNTPLPNDLTDPIQVSRAI